jgi:uncharacterized protein YbaP (TraB family)
LDLGEDMKLIKIVMALLIVTLVINANETLKHPFLWSIEKEGEATSYLFGTMHIPDPDLSQLPLSVKRSIDACDVIRTEIDMSLMNQLEASQLMLRSDKKSLKQILPQKLYTRTENYLKSLHPALNLKPFNQMKIWALSITLSLLENQLKYPDTTIIDNEVFTYAKNQNKDVGGVETIHQQIVYFDEFTLDEQILLLESTLDFLEQEKDYTQTMKKLYIEGNGEKLITFTNQQFGQDKYKKVEEKFMQVLLYNRNKSMVQSMVTLLKTDTKKGYFFAFGVMHFLDKKSIVEELINHGYTVKRIK